MLKKPKASRWAIVLVALLVGAYFAARHLVRQEPSPPEDIQTISAREAAGHTGEFAQVCGTVVDASYVPRTRGAPTFLNFEEPYPDPVFTVVIWENVRRRFRAPPEEAYLDRRVCVTGLVQRHEGRPEIVLDAPEQIRLDGRGATGR